MTDTFSPGDPIRTPDGTVATFFKYLSDGNAIIRVGLDSRIVDPVVLRKAA